MITNEPQTPDSHLFLQIVATFPNMNLKSRYDFFDKESSSLIKITEEYERKIRSIKNL